MRARSPKTDSPERDPACVQRSGTDHRGDIVKGISDHRRVHGRRSRRWLRGAALQGAHTQGAGVRRARFRGHRARAAVISQEEMSPPPTICASSTRANLRDEMRECAAICGEIQDGRRQGTGRAGEAPPTTRPRMADREHGNEKAIEAQGLPDRRRGYDKVAVDGQPGRRWHAEFEQMQRARRAAKRSRSPRRPGSR